MKKRTMHLMLAGSVFCLGSCTWIHQATAPKSRAVQVVQQASVGRPVGTPTAAPVVMLEGDPFDLSLAEAGRSLFDLSRGGAPR